MKSFTREILCFGTAGAMTALTWAFFWPRSVPIAAAPPEAPETTVEPILWSKVRIASLIAAVEKSDSEEAKLNACTDLLQIPVSSVREILEQTNLKDRNRLSQVAKILLIRWAADDGETAILWAWKRFRSEGLWDQAFQEIGPAWAAHNPASLGRWALSAAEKLKPGSNEPTMEDIASMEFPWVDSGMLTDISNWLVTEDPRLAYQLVKKRGGYGSDDSRMPLALTSVAKVREALLVFDDHRIKNPSRLSGDEIHLHYLLARWHELDPDDFNRSTYAGSIVTNTAEQFVSALERWKTLPDDERADAANKLVAGAVSESKGSRISALAEAWAEVDPAATARWLDSLPPENEVFANTARIRALAAHDLTATLDWADRLPARQQRDSIVNAFDAWTKAHPEQPANRTDWPAKRVQAWTDLENLQLRDGR